ncbi:DUF3870 domain-containing protein [Acidaminobacter hydrogenoformans]|uniref:DUF3870 domain-containing protein n=1 Tax=Acidaminobacter hydrogenoformans DSM 2784 TaxID=1120920 RepID=A0A1G5S5P3_9FIRM|nr:DUF3870 domain-containing protein [Acidaminobacter hydrogenoformans]SCZ80879.1 protein of unknown function [Acidaminobacter hydrogenoformans DSM 2784]
MTVYDRNTVYFSAYAKLPCEMPSAHLNQNLDIGLIINYETGIVVGMSCTLITSDTKDFLKSIIVGYPIKELGIEPLIEEIKFRFLGASQKAVCVVLKATYEKYLAWMEAQFAKD